MENNYFSNFRYSFPDHNYQYINMMSEWSKMKVDDQSDKTHQQSTKTYPPPISGNKRIRVPEHINNLPKITPYIWCIHASMETKNVWRKKQNYSADVWKTRLQWPTCVYVWTLSKLKGHFIACAVMHDTYKNTPNPLILALWNPPIHLFYIWTIEILKYIRLQSL